MSLSQDRSFPLTRGETWSQDMDVAGPLFSTHTRSDLESNRDLQSHDSDLETTSRSRAQVFCACHSRPLDCLLVPPHLYLSSWQSTMRRTAMVFFSVVCVSQPVPLVYVWSSFPVRGIISN